MLVAILFTTVLIGVFLLFLLFIGTFIYGAFFAFKLAKFKKNVAKIDSKLVETIKIPYSWISHTNVNYTAIFSHLLLSIKVKERNY